MTRDELKLELKSHDWTYMMTEDARVHRKGRANDDRLRAAAAKLGDEGKKLFNAAHRRAWERPGHPYERFIPFKDVKGGAS